MPCGIEEVTWRILMGTTLLINLAGAIALLLWGTHMISTALLRGFGTQLRNWLGKNLGNRWMALLCGIGITGILQSSTAVSLMATSFTAAGAISLAPALAVMLGANIGSTLVVQLLSVDTSIATPIILFIGFAVFRLRDDSRYESVGCALIGLGLMLLALSLLSSTLQHIEGTSVFRVILQSLEGDLIIAVVAGMLVTWLCHSSVAVVLLISSLAGATMMSPVTAIALMLGANIGGALPSVLSAGSRVARRLPLGNLLVRLSGVLVVLPFLPRLVQATDAFGIGPAPLVVYLHTAFSLALAIVFIGLTQVLAALLTRILAQQEKPADPGMPQYLDEAGLEVANIGLSNAVREALRIADMFSAMLSRVLALFENSTQTCAEDIRRLDHSLDLLSAAIRAYLADIGQDGLSDADADRSQEILMFVINLEHAGDILASNLAQLAWRKRSRGERFSAFELRHIHSLHAELMASLSLAITVFLREDVGAAHQLIGHKETVRKLEAGASQEHFRKLRDDKSAWAESGDIFQRVLRDYRRVHHHIAALAYPLLERSGERNVDIHTETKTEPLANKDNFPCAS